MAFTHSLISLEALDRARSLARLIGGQDYLQLQAKSISDALLARPSLPKHITKRENSQWVQHNLRRTEVKPSEQRRLPAKQREKLRTQYPAAYRAAVTEKKPEHAHQVRLDAVKTGTKSGEWARYKGEGVAEWKGKLEQRFGSLSWSPIDQANALFDLRTLRRAEEGRVEAARAELAEFVISNELPLIVPGLEDGQLVLRENPMSYEINYDLLEERFPQAAVLINRTAVKGSVRIDFAVWQPTAEDPDDSDDSAFGSDYKARMANRPSLWV